MQQKGCSDNGAAKTDQRQGNSDKGAAGVQSALTMDFVRTKSKKQGFQDCQGALYIEHVDRKPFGSFFIKVSTETGIFTVLGGRDLRVFSK